MPRSAPRGRGRPRCPPRAAPAGRGGGAAPAFVTIADGAPRSLSQAEVRGPALPPPRRQGAPASPTPRRAAARAGPRREQRPERSSTDSKTAPLCGTRPRSLWTSSTISPPSSPPAPSRLSRRPCRRRPAPQPARPHARRDLPCPRRQNVSPRPSLPSPAQTPDVPRPSPALSQWLVPALDMVNHAAKGNSEWKWVPTEGGEGVFELHATAAIKKGARLAPSAARPPRAQGACRLRG